MKPVKADSKGRLTGADPDRKYTRIQHRDGSITFRAENPNPEGDTHDVTEEQFTAFFKVSPWQASADEDLIVKPLSTAEMEGGKYLPTGIVVTYYAFDNEGRRIYENGGNPEMRSLLIRIRRS